VTIGIYGFAGALRGALAPKFPGCRLAVRTNHKNGQVTIIITDCGFNPIFPMYEPARETTTENPKYGRAALKLLAEIEAVVQEVKAATEKDIYCLVAFDWTREQNLITRRNDAENYKLRPAIASAPGGEQLALVL